MWSAFGSGAVRRCGRPSFKTRPDASCSRYTEGPAALHAPGPQGPPGPEACRLHNPAELIKELRRKHHKEAKQAHNRLYYKRNKAAILARRRARPAPPRPAPKGEGAEGAEGAPRDKQARKHKNKLYYLKNQDHIKLQKKWYRQHNKEAIKEQQKLYTLKNHHRIQAIQRDYRLRNSLPRSNKRWTSVKDVRLFFESVTSQLYISEPKDWYRISHTQMCEVGGGSLYNVFGNLGKALKYAYPEVEWQLSKFSFRGKKSSQRWLSVVLQHILPEQTDVLEDFLHPDLLWGESSRSKMELDIWVPKYQLALEYQGEHHYHDICSAYGPTGTVSLYTKRDIIKKATCSGVGISLVTIPYWWDGKKDSLSSTLHRVFPEVFQETEAPVIPNFPPKSNNSSLMNNEIGSFLMNGQDWNGEQDPTGWMISEKLDGFRAFWDGSKFYSKNGHVLPVPLEFRRVLPHDVCLDGELWMGYGNFGKLTSVLRKTGHEKDPQKISLMWKEVKYCVFDAPVHPGHYIERHSFAKQSISGCGPNIDIIPITQCHGLGHLKTILTEITLKKGEGVMLYHPQSTYTSGRTNKILKVKSFSEQDVRFVGANLNSYSFICEQQNGTLCVVKCGGWDYMFPPSPGTVLTVKHNGFFSSNKMKFPFLLRVRPELNWNQIKTNSNNS